MDAQMKREVKDMFKISDSQLNIILKYPDKKVILKDGRNFIYVSEADMIAEIEGFSYTLTGTDEQVDTLEEYLKHIKENDIKSLEEVIEDIGDTPITDNEVEVMERFKINTKTIKNTWENI